MIVEGIILTLWFGLLFEEWREEHRGLILGGLRRLRNRVREGSRGLR